MSDLVTLAKDGDVAVITVNNPPVNALSPGVPEGIVAHLQTATADPAVKAIVIIGGGRTFIAGADIKEFGKITSGQKKRDEGLTSPLIAIENCSKPVICAIHGTAFGGGLELAQACHYRVAVPNAQVGQPEVKLGLIPGGAGTQRLPRLAGVAHAAELCALGNPIPTKQAHEWGIIDQLIEGDLLAGAVAFARKQGASGKPPRLTREISDRFGDPAANATALAELRKQAARQFRGMKAPLRAIEAVEAAAKLSFEEGCKKEAELFK